MGRARAEKRHPERYASRDVSVTYIRPDYHPGQFTDSLAKMLLWDSTHNNRVGQIYAFASGPLIAQARNEVAKAFMLGDTDWLLMLDADMAFKAPILDQMLNVIVEKATIAKQRADIKVLGALCYKGGRTFVPEPTIYAEPEPGVLVPAPHVPPDALLKVPGTGAACLLVHRQVIEDIHTKYEDDPYTWFKEYHEAGVGSYGEDITFCLRARECGHDVWVHTGFKIGHMKLVPLTDYTARRLQFADAGELAAEELAYYDGLGVR